MGVGEAWGGRVRDPATRRLEVLLEMVARGRPFSRGEFEELKAARGVHSVEGVCDGERWWVKTVHMGERCCAPS